MYISAAYHYLNGDQPEHKNKGRVKPHTLQ